MAGGKHRLITSCVRDINRLCLFEEFVRSSYLPYVQQNKRSWKTDERYLNRHILTYLGSCPLAEISEENSENPDTPDEASEEKIDETASVEEKADETASEEEKPTDSDENQE